MVKKKPTLPSAPLAPPAAHGTGRKPAKHQKLLGEYFLKPMGEAASPSSPTHSPVERSTESGCHENLRRSERASRAKRRSKSCSALSALSAFLPQVPPKELQGATPLNKSLGDQEGLTMPDTAPILAHCKVQVVCAQVLRPALPPSQGSPSDLNNPGLGSASPPATITSLITNVASFENLEKGQRVLDSSLNLGLTPDLFNSSTKTAEQTCSPPMSNLNCNSSFNLAPAPKESSVEQELSTEQSSSKVPNNLWSPPLQSPLVSDPALLVRLESCIERVLEKTPLFIRRNEACDAQPSHPTQLGSWDFSALREFRDREQSQI